MNNIKKKRTNSAVKAVEKDLDPKNDGVSSLLEKGKKAGLLTYEELMEFAERGKLSDVEINDLMRQLEREHIDLIMEEELTTDSGELETFDETITRIPEAKPVLEHQVAILPPQCALAVRRRGLRGGRLSSIDE